MKTCCRCSNRKAWLSRPSSRTTDGNSVVAPDHHPYELFLQLEGIEHRTTKVRRPQSNGFIERLHRTLLDEHFRIAGRTKWYESIEEMQKDLDVYLKTYNEKRPHQGRLMNGRTPAEMFKRKTESSMAVFEWAGFRLERPLHGPRRPKDGSDRTRRCRPATRCPSAPTRSEAHPRSWADARQRSGTA